MKRRIEITLAGAGSGKTTALVHTLEAAIASGDAQPDKVLATTFTRAAAAELAGRARTQLIAAGHVQAAHRLGAARIGTVNAVCGALVESYAFELGLSPQLRVLDEDAASQLIRGCIAEVRTPALERRAQHAIRMLEMKRGEFDLRVTEVLAAARANGLDPQALRDSAHRSVASLDGLLDPPGHGGALDAGLEHELREARRLLQHATAKTDMAARAKIDGTLAVLERGDLVPWAKWQSLASLQTTASLSPRLDALRAAAAAHLQHPRLRGDLQDVIRLVFELAGSALERYAAAKRERGLLDFADQESLALELLRLPEVAPRIAEELDLVLVDEFQDTSPIQLSICLELAKLAKRSVWVGDPKQSIYGFRGTDPDMMDAAIALLERRDPAFVDDALARLFEQTTPKTLGKSHRSRPHLVDLTSALFTRAFATQGMPRQRVALEPAHLEEPEGLGPVVELWNLDKGELRPTIGHPAAVAAGVHALLQDGFTVRCHGDPGTTRPGTAADVAVLSRRRAPRDQVAVALEDLGHAVALPRTGLLDTLEGRALWAGLRRWVDDHDRHAEAELSRLLGDSDPDAWLDDLLRDRSAPIAQRIDARRAEVHGAGVVAIAEHCMDALQLRTACRRWGDAEERLANLDAFVHLTRTYEERARASRGAATLPGLLAALEEATDDQERADVRGIRGANAVEASTWHGAKGLEWPVVVLHDLDTAFPDRPGGVSIEPNDEGLDLADPLRGRWIRFVPNPYHGATRRAAFLERLADAPWERRASQRRAAEQLRVLYVAWTRARDRLVLAGPAKTLFERALATLADGEGPLLDQPSEGRACWADVDLNVPSRTYGPRPPTDREAPPVPTTPPPLEASYAPAFDSPSAAVGTAPVVEQIRIGPATIVTGLQGAALGDAFHAFAAADPPDATMQDRKALARRCLTTWALGQPQLAGTFVRAMDRLRAYVRERYGSAPLHREVPAWYRAPDGTMLRGTLDAWIPRLAVIDHKALLGGVPRQIEAAREYGGQLEAYARIAQATHGLAVDRWIHLPMAGLMVRLG